MKAISLWQPWASLVALRLKRIETRSWATKYRGPLAIHAAATRDMWEVVHEEPFRSVLLTAGIIKINDLPYGAVIATCNLVECVKIINSNPEHALLDERYGVIEGNEFAFGDYTPGRFAWMVEDVQRLPKPVPANGFQRLWNWEPPEEVGIL